MSPMSLAQDTNALIMTWLLCVTGLCSAFCQLGPLLWHQMWRDPCTMYHWASSLSFSGLRQFRQWLADWNTDGTGGRQIVSEENMGHSDTSTSGHVSTRGPSLLPDADTGERWCDGGRLGDYLPRPAQTRPLVLSCDPGSAGATLHHYTIVTVTLEQSRDLETEDSDYYSGDKRCEAVLVLARSSTLFLTELSGNLRVPWDLVMGWWWETLGSETSRDSGHKVHKLGAEMDPPWAEHLSTWYMTEEGGGWGLPGHVSPLPPVMMPSPGDADEIKWSHWDLIAFVNSNNADSSGVKYEFGWYKHCVR